MSAERFVRSLIIAAACVATAWWLLRDSPPQERPSASARPRTDARVLEPRAADSPNNELFELDTQGDVPVAEARWSAPPAVSAAGSAAEPIPMIEGITLPGGMWNLHAMMEREPRDAAWADDMERRFATYFASKPELGRSFSQPSILCRSHFCEIQAVGYGPRAFDTWKTATADLRDQPWASSMRGGGIYTIERAPNEQAVVLILMRPWIIPRDDRVEARLPASK